MMRQIRCFGSVLLAGSLLSLISFPAIAQQDRLTDAEVYRLRNNVQLLLRNQAPRPARVADVLVPQDSLRTALNSIAELLFNEGSIARVDQNTTFRFESGMRRFELRNRIAMNETIFVLENGTALIISPPDSVGTQIQTPESRISILPGGETAAIPTSVRSAQFPIETLALETPVLVAMRLLTNSSLKVSPSIPSSHLSIGNISSFPQFVPSELAQSDSTADLLPPPERSSAVMVVHDNALNSTQVFALTDGDITVGDRTGEDTVALAGGQTVAVANGQIGEVQEFDLAAFYQSVPLAAGLGPDQESIVAQESESVQVSLNAVRPETLAAVANQRNRLIGFSSTFLQDALGGIDRDFNGQRGESSFVIINPQTTTGTFTVNRYNDDVGTATFTDSNGNQIPITVDFDDRSISINGQRGISNNAGLSGDNASGTVILQNGRAIRVEVFGVNGDRPNAGQNYPGSLTTGIAPDR
jgi:hypothetical protein